MVGNDIIRNARNQLKEFIVFEVRNLWNFIKKQNPNFGNDEEWVIGCEELLTNVSCGISISDGVLSHYEFRYVERIKVTLDDNVFFDLEDCDGEYEWTELSTDELGRICNSLESTYLGYVQNK